MRDDNMKILARNLEYEEKIFSEVSALFMVLALVTVVCCKSEG